MSRARKPSRRAAPDLTDLQAELRGHGLRSTGPRVAVLAYVSAATAPRSHPEVYEALAPRGYDRVTIYRNLTDLVQAGLLVRTDLGDHVWRFERSERVHARSGRLAGHPHFVCVDCGEVSCLPDVSVKVVPSSATPKALGAHQIAVQVMGRCDECT